MFQLYVRVSHSVEQNTSLADFDPPFTDPHIDDIFIEADIESITYDSLNLVSTTYTRTGVYDRATLSVSLHVRCALNYFGSACEMLCDSNGINCNNGAYLVLHQVLADYLYDFIHLFKKFFTYIFSIN